MQVVLHHLFHAHSGLRYLVLLAGAVAFLWFLYGAIARKPWRAPAPAALAAVLGLLDLQALIGIVLWIGGRTAAGIVEHLSLMLAAAVAVHVASIVHKRRTEPGF